MDMTLEQGHCILNWQLTGIWLLHFMEMVSCWVQPMLSVRMRQKLKPLLKHWSTYCSKTCKLCTLCIIGTQRLHCTSVQACRLGDGHDSFISVWLECTCCILFTKLKNFNTSHCLLKWFAWYLFRRCQRVRVGSRVSSWKTLCGSMPQASRLEPLSFIVSLLLPDSVNCKFRAFFVYRQIPLLAHSNDVTFTAKLHCLQIPASGKNLILPSNSNTWKL